MQLHYRSYGEGQPVIILHGLFGMLDNWKTIAKKLSEDFMVYIIDLRNHGKSPHHPDMSYPIMAQDINQFMEDQWIFNAHIIGHSMGGKVALHLLDQYPDKIDKLCVVDIAPVTYQGNHQAIFNTLFNTPLTQYKTRSEIKDWMVQQLDDLSIVQFLLKNIGRSKEDGTFQWKMNLEAIHKAYPDILSQELSSETDDKEILFIRGEQSDYITEQIQIQTKSKYPNAHFVTVEGSGHWVHAEHPAEFLKISLQFLHTTG